jgi:hypothetical protein
MRLAAAILILGVGCSTAFAAGQTDGTRLATEYFSVSINANGALTEIENVAAKERYAAKSDDFTIETDRGTWSNPGAKAVRSDIRKDRATYSFSFKDCDVALEYSLHPGRKYIERKLTVSNIRVPLTLLKIELGRTVFERRPSEAINYDTFWYAPTVSFLRFEKGGLFTGIENPFFSATHDRSQVALAFEPSLFLKPGETYESEPQFLGVYQRSGRMISDWWPRTAASSREGQGNRPRFRNPCGQVPLDWNEIQAIAGVCRRLSLAAVRAVSVQTVHVLVPN